MAIVFTDDQLKNISKEVMSTPDQVAALESNGAALVKNKDDLKKTDDNNIVFQTNYLNIIHQYHSELSLLRGQLRTNYDVSQVELAVKRTPGNIHFTSGWPNFQPKLVDSLKGLPTSTLPDHEDIHVAKSVMYIDILKIGYTDGAISQSVSGYFSAGVLTMQTSPSFGVGQRITVSGASGFVFGYVQSINNNDVILRDYISNGTITSGNVAKNFFPGYSNAQREAHPVGDFAFDGFVNELNNQSTIWRNFLSNQLDTLKANDSGDTENAQAITNLNRSISLIKSWQSGVSYGVGVGRYGDGKIVPLRADAAGRVNEIINREAQIITRLDTITQAADGSFSGKGHYFNLFKWIDIRINIVSGSLTAYYGSSLGVLANAQLVAAAQQKQNEYASKFIVSIFTESSVVSNKVKLKSVDGFVTGKTAKIIADDQDVISAQINAISVIDKTLTFDKIIPATFKTENNSRVLMSK